MKLLARQLSRFAVKFAFMSGVALVAASSLAVERTVEFRDGTILRVTIPDGPLPWHKATPDGTVTKAPMPWEKVDQLYLVTTPALEKLAEIRGLLTQLGGAKYADRVEAHKTLIEKGVHFRGVVEEIFKSTMDPEIRWRLEAILKAMEGNVEPAQFNYDLVRIKGTGEEVEGDVGELALTADFRGAKVTLDRKGVCRINNSSAIGDELLSSELGRSEVIADDDDKMFPKNVTRVSFDRGPDGELLVPGRDIHSMFVPLGCTFSTSEKDSFISVEDYNVRGRSGQLCIATHDPLYQGAITVRFCLPGNAEVPAGVHCVGFWTAYVEPAGTALEAYDVHDRLIGVARTKARGRDFLCVKSATPIAYIRAICNEEIDKDFAIDDLFFDPPVTLAEASDKQWLTVLLAGGERIKCRNFTRTGEKIELKDLSIGVPSVTVPLADVISLMPAGETVKPSEAAADNFVLLDDGSILRAKGGEKLTTPAGADIPIERLVALWGSGTTFMLPSDDAWPAAGAVVLEAGKAPKAVADWKLGPNWITGAGLEGIDFTYANSPMIWFRKPAERPKTAGLLRLAGGEEYTLGDAPRYQLTSWTPEKVTLKRGDQSLDIPFEQVTTLRLPRAK